MEEKSELICDSCKIEFEEIEAQFRYLGKSFRNKVMRCPNCGQVYLPESLVTGRIKDVEKLLEDK